MTWAATYRITARAGIGTQRSTNRITFRGIPRVATLFGRILSHGKFTTGYSTRQSSRSNEEANSLLDLGRQTARLWRKHHLTYDQTKHVVEHVRRELRLEAPKQRRRTVDRLDRTEIERLIEAAYDHSSQYGFMVKMLFYTGARVSEFVQFRVADLHLALDPPQVYIAQAKGGSDGYVPILPALAQELRTHLNGRRTGYVFESNRCDRYTTRYVQRLVQGAARRAGIEKHVTPHRLRASVATILLDAGMPLDQVQKFLRHKRITTTQIYAETSLHGMSENYMRALGGKR